MSEGEKKSLEIRDMLLKAFGQRVSPYIYSLTINEAKRLLKSENKLTENYVHAKPIKTLAII